MHDEDELDRALAAGSRLVGVNQRDLRTFQVDHERACSLAARIPSGVVAVAESGIRNAADARRLAEAGYDAILVGETLVRAGDRVGRLRELVGSARRAAMTDDLFVKICGITSEADALLAVSLGASAVGFIFAPSPRQVSAQLAGDIAKRLPEHVLTVGVFRDEAPQRVVEAVHAAGLGAAQLHGHETAEETQWVRARVPTVIKAFRAGERAIARFEDFGADYLLVDGDNPGSGQVFDWRLAEGVADPHRLIVSGGLRPDNVAQAVAHLRPAGVDVATGVESAPGRKDPLLLRDFIVNARRAAAGRVGPRRAGRDAHAAEPYDWRDG